jgi:hypothetical protein
MQKDEYERIKERTGIWFKIYPQEVDENPELAPMDKKVWWVVWMKDSGTRHCFASNGYIAKRLKTTVKVVSSSINKLIKLGYIKLVKAPNQRGMGRVIKIDSTYHTRYAALREEFDDLWHSEDDYVKGIEPPHEQCTLTCPQILYHTQS